MLSSVNVISQEEKVGAGRETTHLEHSDQIRVLTVDVSYDFDWRIQLEEGWLIEE
jgi:hypothetical protein